jgi:hypothetical protein
MGTGSFPGVKRTERGVDHPPPSSAEVKERVEYIYGIRAVKTQLSYLLANDGTLVVNNYMFRPLYLASSRCTSYNNVTIQYTQSVTDDEISLTTARNTHSVQSSSLQCTRIT